MPMPHELNERFPPFLTRGCVLFLNDLHEFRDDVVLDQKLRFYVEDRKFKTVATIPCEKYDSNWPVLSRFIWDEISLGTWSLEEGRRLARTKSIKLEPSTFRGTPLSVLAPDAELRRSYELLPAGGKAVLQVLKIIKSVLGCFADYELISAMQSPQGKFDHSDFQHVVSKGDVWCKTHDSRCMLADGLEDIIPYEVSSEDANRLQTVLLGEG